MNPEGELDWDFYMALATFHNHLKLVAARLVGGDQVDGHVLAAVLIREARAM